MDPVFPRPLVPGDLVGVTSPSSGVPEELRPRLEVALASVRDAGLEVELGACMDGAGLVSAAAPDRARELQRMLLDPSIRAIVPPWGGDLAIDLLELLNWEAIAGAEPTWVVGFSDVSTLLTPLTLLTGWATLHGQNLLETPCAPPAGLRSWLDIVTLPPGATVAQTSPGAHRSEFVDWVEHPEVDEYVLDAPGAWTRLDELGGVLDVEGRLLGGCVETLSPLAGTRFLDPSRLVPPGGGLVLYLDIAEFDAAATCRALHGMRLNGVFDHASVVLVGRTDAPSLGTFTQHDAVIDALGPLGIPVLADVECGHVAPYMPLVNGARCRVEHTPSVSRVTQTLGSAPTPQGPAAS